MEKKQTLSLYWKCQLIGWSLAALYWQYLGLTGGTYVFYFGIIQFITDVCLYILLTHTYRNFALIHHWQQLDLNKMVIRIIPAILVMGIAYLLVTVLKIYFLRILFISDYNQSLVYFFKADGMNIFIGGIRLMSIWLLAYHLYQYAQREISLAKLNAELAIISRDAQLNNLSAQLNPHFLFNSLNTIKSLIVEKPNTARRAIDLLAELLRNGLYKSESDLTTLSIELDRVKDYLELETLRMEERLRTEIKVDKALIVCSIPRFSIQTLIENAIKHGVAKQKNGGLVMLDISKKDNLICISITNPGKLDYGHAKAGIGLKNLRARLILEYQNSAKLEVVDKFNGFIYTTLLIPIR
ncbi:MAG: histidine kinase [Bacteroidota bacterium]